jgi:hypothetical protein
MLAKVLRFLSDESRHVSAKIGPPGRQLVFGKLQDLDQPRFDRRRNYRRGILMLRKGDIGRPMRADA